MSEFDESVVGLSVGRVTIQFMWFNIFVTVETVSNGFVPRGRWLGSEALHLLYVLLLFLERAVCNIHVVTLSKKNQTATATLKRCFGH